MAARSKLAIAVASSIIIVASSPGGIVGNIIVGATSTTNNEDHESLYFPGDEGDECRQSAIEEWKASSSTPPADNSNAAVITNFLGVPFTKETLDNIMSTELYQRARNHCMEEIGLYNRASGVVCLLESQNKPNLTYNEFWMASGPYYFDGEMDLATMFTYTGNFTKIAIDVNFCMADCYLGSKYGSSCDDVATWLKYYGQVPLEEYCNNEWGRIDQAYFSLKLCAAEAIGDPTSEDGLSRREYVGQMQAQEVTYSICKYRYCDSDVYEYIKGAMDNKAEEGDDGAASSSTTASTDFAKEVVKIGLRH